MNAEFPRTRAAARVQLEDFLPRAAAYAARRNYVESGHGNVSRLSPAVRTRLLLERELVSAVRTRHGNGGAEKFEQEVAWRRYWKGWLERRPRVWSLYREDLAEMSLGGRAEEVAEGRSGVAIMDHFARELLETGYLHNHARMWWASFWIHVERLPWQLGAGWFLRHLLDGDAASNTLSWRWVAGMHTAGKTYLVRRPNLERYLAPELMEANRAGLGRLKSSTPAECRPEALEPPLPMEPGSDGETARLEGRRWGLWLHDEDLLPEDSPLAGMRPLAATATATAGMDAAGGSDSAIRRTYLRSALDDGATRASAHFGIPCPVQETVDLAADLAAWTQEHRLESVVSMRPFVGPLADRLPSVEAALSRHGVRLCLIRRPEDRVAMRCATGGFFGFWKRLGALETAG